MGVGFTSAPPAGGAPAPARSAALEARLELAAGDVKLVRGGAGDLATSGAAILADSRLVTGKGARALARLADVELLVDAGPRMDVVERVVAVADLDLLPRLKPGNVQACFAALAAHDALVLLLEDRFHLVVAHVSHCHQHVDQFEAKKPL